MKVAMLGMALLTLGLTPVALGDSPTIYRCDSDGAVIYSDRPCAADAVVHENDGSRVTVYAAPPSSGAAPSQSSKRAAHKTRSARPAGADLEQRRAQCAKLDQALRDVRTKMRTGYRVKEGERLKARQRQLSERRRSQNCG
jgi:hypothetical protein